MAHKNSQAVIRQYVNESETGNELAVIGLMANEIADARDMFSQIERATDLENVKLIARAYLESHGGKR